MNKKLWATVAGIAFILSTASATPTLAASVTPEFSTVSEPTTPSPSSNFFDAEATIDMFIVAGDLSLTISGPGGINFSGTFLGAGVGGGHIKGGFDIESLACDLDCIAQYGTSFRLVTTATMTNVYFYGDYGYGEELLGTFGSIDTLYGVGAFTGIGSWSNNPKA
ncbi:hypothetical protein [Lysinibacter sp. HNR]|uniref:hypothetical protein n=1 Tax=Lysinibacter sp. HNR TaxID=3031408 RepID=UPI00243536CF|nr:hypothetical protein [Lysinibacter sp. HNR]WGD37028.1 hypothetical protein FrondiHNR_11365 [Lysinibacter sp. HNR]